MKVDKRLAPVDAVVVGVGLAGSIVAAELTRAGIDVVGLERGPDRSAESSELVRKHDELRFRVRHEMVQDVALESWTVRHHHRERALPLRRAGAFAPASGVGGSSAHYGGLTTRFAPWEFELHSRTVERYGEGAVPAGTTMQDWGIGYDELERYYDRFEQVIGVSGKAGNLNGELRYGGNPFEGPRSREFPLPPLKVPSGPALFRTAAEELGYHPYPSPSAILPHEYTNPDGITRQGCVYCGDCTFHLCAVDAKGDGRVAILPAALRSGRFELRPDAYVVEVVRGTRRVHGVRYYDSAGALVEQPAGIVVLSAYALNNVRLLLLSGIGEPYDPETGAGLVGKNSAYQITLASTAFFKERRFKNYISSSGSILADDLANDNFDHSGLGFVGGATLISAAQHSLVNGPPLPPGSPRWGHGWKRAMHEWYDRNLTVGFCGHSLPYRTHHLDLDPIYRDAWGLPLLRLTFDWRENERRLAAYVSGRLGEFWRALDADAVLTHELPRQWDAATYSSTHNTGGAIMGTDPSTSVVNSWLQAWVAENLFIVGGSAFPQNGTPGPSGTIGALAYRAAEGMIEFARSPRLLE